MRLSRRSKVSLLLSPLAVLTILGTLMLSGVFSRVVPTHAANASSFSVVKGTITRSGPVDTAVPAAVPISKGVRSIHAGSRNASGITASSSGLDGQAGALLSNFNGVGSRASANTNFGAEFEPPDQGLCVGNGFVVEPVNSAYTIYHTNGSIIAGPFNVNRLFDDGFRQFTSDPRCYFDKSTNTWFAIILFISANNKHARTDIAVNPSGDPTTPWTVYRLDATDDGTNGTPSHPGCPCLGDQPLLGIDKDNLYVSTNEFSILGPQFNGAQIYALSKSQLVHLASSVNFVHFGNLRNGGTIAASVQPAITNGSAKAEYFMDSLDPNGTFDNRVAVWALTDGDVVSQGGTPTLSNVVITSEPYGVPPKAAQKGATSKLDSGDDRMQQVQYINGDLWGALDTAVTIPNDTTERAGAAWFRVHPSLNGEVIGGATIVHQGYVALRGNYLLYPAIQASAEGTAAIVMTLSGRTFFPSAVYTVMQEGQNAFGSIHVAAFGTTHYDVKATRWGDYSWAILDPSGNSFWMATEYIPPLFSQTVDGKRNWGTRVIQVSAQD
jgi:hypothetical protein